MQPAFKKQQQLLRSVTSLRECQAATNGCFADAIESVLEEVRAQGQLNAYITETPDLARAQAIDSDERIARGKPRNLEGVPLSIKDNYCTRGIRTTAGSRMLANFIPTYDAFVYRQVLDAGAVCIDLPSISYALPTYYIIALSEASSNLARYDGVHYGYRAPNANDLIDLYERTRAEGFRWETKKRIIMGTYALSAGYYEAYYERACRVRRLISDELNAVLSHVDCFMWPTAPTPAFEFGSHASDPLSMYLEDVFAVPINLAGLPAISVPNLNRK